MKKSVPVAQKVKVSRVERRPAEVDTTFLYASDDTEWKQKIQKTGCVLAWPTSK